MSACQVNSSKFQRTFPLQDWELLGFTVFLRHLPTAGGGYPATKK